MYKEPFQPRDKDVFDDDYSRPVRTTRTHGPWAVRTARMVDTGERDAVLSLVDDVSTWQPGDKIVIASSDYDMNHAEVFTLVHCRSCTANQVKVNG